MGFTTHQTGERKIFANIINGKFAVKAKEKSETTVSRISTHPITKEEKEVHEHLYDSLNGMLKSVTCEYNEKLRANQYVVIIEDVGDIYNISIPADSAYGDSFVSKLMNLKNNKEITLTPYNFNDKEKKDKNGNPRKVTGVSILQDGVKVERFYSKENPKGMPEYTEGMDKDDWKIYNINLRKFFRQECERWVRLNMDKVKPEEHTPHIPTPVQQKNKAVPSITKEESSGDDDLPF